MSALERALLRATRRRIAQVGMASARLWLRRRLAPATPAPLVEALLRRAAPPRLCRGAR